MRKDYQNELVFKWKQVNEKVQAWKTSQAEGYILEGQIKPGAGNCHTGVPAAPREGLMGGAAMGRWAAVKAIKASVSEKR